MTCIDAAIIKALVEHIGMNPDDVTVGGASSHTDIPIDVNWSTYEGSNGYTYYRIDYPDGINGRQINEGDIIVMEQKSKPGTFSYWYCVCNGLEGLEVINELGIKQDFVKDGIALQTTINADTYTPVGMYQINTAKSLHIALASLSMYRVSKNSLASWRSVALSPKHQQHDSDHKQRH